MNLTLLLILISACTFAQQKKEVPAKKEETKKGLDELYSLWQYDKFKIYEPDKCNCPVIKPGEKFPDSHPNAKYLNDTTLWEWRQVDLGGGWKEKVFDLKPQYKDTLKLNDGTFKEVPVWLKNPNWRKPEEKTKTIL